MNTLEKYLDVMFQEIKEGPETEKAKESLREMMEDKYKNLLEEGCSQEEAAARVMAEMGDVEELKETLGVRKNETHYGKDLMNFIAEQFGGKEPVSADMTEEEYHQFMKDFSRRSLDRCLAWVFLLGSFLAFFGLDAVAQSETVTGIGVGLMIMCWGVGIGMFFLGRSRIAKWKEGKWKTATEIKLNDDLNATWKNKKEVIRTRSMVLRILGFALICGSLIPLLVLRPEQSGEISTGISFLVAGMGAGFVSYSMGQGYLLKFSRKMAE